MRHYPATSNLPLTPRSSLKCTRPEQNSIKISLITVAALTQQRPWLARYTRVGFRRRGRGGDETDDGFDGDTDSDGMTTRLCPSHETPMNLATFKNVPVVTLCWVAFFVLCFVIFLVLSLCSGMKEFALTTDAMGPSLT